MITSGGGSGYKRPGAGSGYTAPATGRGGGSRVSTPNRAPAPAPAPQPYSPPSMGNYEPISYGGGGGGGGGGSYAASYAPPPPPPPPPDKGQWIASNEGYKAQRDALVKALADYQTNYDAEISQYDVDFGKGLKNLGWDYEKLDDPNTKDVNEGVGKWNLEDQTRSSGRAYQGQLNDFASRNLLQSSLYAQAVSDLMKSLDEQNTQMNTSRQNFRNDKGRALGAFKTDNESQKNLAYADAAERYAALFGV